MQASHPLRQAGLVILLGVVFAVLLTGIQLGLKDRIAANKKAEIIEQIPLMFPGAEAANAVERPVKVQGKLQTLWEVRGADQTAMGYLLPTSGLGFNDQIELLIALSIDRKSLIGIHVIDQKETPGLGDNIVQSRFTQRFRGKPSSGLQAVKTGARSDSAEIDAISGATVSSQSVCDIINRAVSSLEFVEGQK